MWTQIHLEVQLVWDDALWSVIATYRENGEGERILLEKRGRCSWDADGGPDSALLAVVQALQKEAFEGH